MNCVYHVRRSRYLSQNAFAIVMLHEAPMPSVQWKEERKRVKAAKQEAVTAGREILTPMGAAYLCGKSLETIRQARRAEPEKAVAFILGLEDRPVPMLRLQ